MNEKILIVDDDKKMAGLLREFLTRSGYQVFTVYNGNDAVMEAQRLSPDIMILDLMLPGKDGFEVCREIRKKNNLPIIMLTARGDVTDRIVGLEIGADDYLPKPFEPRELTARIQSILRRTNFKTESVKISFNELELDFRRHEATLCGNPLDLTTMEFQILSLFAKNPGIVFDRDTIFEKLKGFDDDSYDRSIDVLISRLRQKLGDDPKSPKFIRTIWGSGYKFIAVNS